MTNVNYSTADVNKPCLAIAVGMGWGVRNYLLSDTLPTLQESFRVVVVSDYLGDRDLCEFLQSRGVGLLPVENPVLPGLAQKLYRLTEAAYFQRTGTTSHRRKLAQQTGLGGLLSRLPGLKYTFPALRSAYRRRLQAQHPEVPRLKAEFRKLGVVGLFSTNCFEPAEWPAVLAAQALGLPTVAAVTSWDNPTTQRFCVTDHQRYLVWNESMAERLVSVVGIDREQIDVVGAPQFDFYFKPELRVDRTTFCQDLGLDPDRKFVLYPTVTPTIVPDNPQLIRQLYDLVLRDFPGRPQLLVRLHPKDDMDRYAELRADSRYREIAWTSAGKKVTAGRDQWLPDQASLRLAVNSVLHSDVNLHAGFSTMMLDSAVVDQPVILLGFDSTGDSARSKSYEAYEHLQPILSSGAMTLTRNWGEARNELKAVFSEPKKGSNRRDELARVQAGFWVGFAGSRIGAIVASSLAFEAFTTNTLNATINVAQEKKKGLLESKRPRKITVN